MLKVVYLHTAGWAPPREQKVAESFSTSLPFVHFAEYFKNTILPRKGG